jgi:hypothetical protein
MTKPYCRCPGHPLAEEYVSSLEAEIERMAAAEGIDTDGIAHLWKHVLEAALKRVVRLSPESVVHVEKLR